MFSDKRQPAQPWESSGLWEWRQELGSGIAVAE